MAPADMNTHTPIPLHPLRNAQSERASERPQPELAGIISDFKFPAFTTATYENLSDTTLHSDHIAYRLLRGDSPLCRGSELENQDRTPLAQDTRVHRRLEREI